MYEALARQASFDLLPAPKGPQQPSVPMPGESLTPGASRYLILPLLDEVTAPAESAARAQLILLKYCERRLAICRQTIPPGPARP